MAAHLLSYVDRSAAILFVIIATDDQSESGFYRAYLQFLWTNCDISFARGAKIDIHGEESYCLDRSSLLEP
jgi:hypothetical protein